MAQRCSHPVRRRFRLGFGTSLLSLVLFGCVVDDLSHGPSRAPYEFREPEKLTQVARSPGAEAPDHCTLTWYGRRVCSRRLTRGIPRRGWVNFGSARRHRGWGLIASVRLGFLRYIDIRHHSLAADLNRGLNVEFWNDVEVESPHPGCGGRLG